MVVVASTSVLITAVIVAAIIIIIAADPAFRPAMDFLAVLGEDAKFASKCETPNTKAAQQGTSGPTPEKYVNPKSLPRRSSTKKLDPRPCTRGDISKCGCKQKLLSPSSMSRSIKKFWKLHVTRMLPLAAEPRQGLDTIAKARARRRWLREVVRNGRHRVGCLACQEYTKAGGLRPGGFRREAWGDFQVEVAGLKKFNVIRHALSQSHRAAVAWVMGMDEKIAHAPPLTDFKDMLRNLSKGISLRSCHPRAVSSDRVHAMAWCLGEAEKQIDQDFLRNATTICLTRDARQERLVVRFGACRLDSMEVRRGLLGMARGHGDRAADIVRGTRAVLEAACAINAKPPRMFRGRLKECKSCRSMSPKRLRCLSLTQQPTRCWQGKSDAAGAQPVRTLKLPRSC